MGNEQLGLSVLCHYSEINVIKDALCMNTT